MILKQKPLNIYSSSAGSGKTWTLTKSYLELVLKNPPRFRNILAVTFTKKATEEMKTRIVKTLYNLSLAPEKDMGPVLAQSLGLPASEIKSRASETLQLILHDYSAFAVSTIDSFFQSIIRSFARETDLGANFRLEMDQELVLDDVIKRLLIEIGPNKRLTDWLTDFAISKVEDAKSWDFDRDIRNLAQEIFKEKFKEFEDEIRSLPDSNLFFDKFKTDILAVAKTFESTMAHCGNQANAIFAKYNLSPDDFSNKGTGFGGWITRLNKRVSYDRYTPNKLVMKVLSKEGNPYAASSKRKHEIDAAMSGPNGLYAIGQRAADYYHQHITHYLTAQNVSNYIYTLGILADLAKNLEGYRKDNNVFLMSDASSFLHKIIDNNDIPFVFEKTGNQYQHFFLDEFQDTSALQWLNLRPLLENSLALGNRNLIVGDVKQSIYRWRGGEPDLLKNQVPEQMGPENTQILNLDTNYRSLKTVIDFNNSVFELAPRVLALDLIAKSGSDLMHNLAANLGNAYSDSFQKLSEGKNGGYVRVNFIDETSGLEEEMLEEDDETEEVYTGSDELSKSEKNRLTVQNILSRIPIEIENLLDAGFKLSDICILVRTAWQGSSIANAIMAYKNAATPEKVQKYGYDVISSESLYLNQCRSVRLIINALKYLLNTTDHLALASLILEYQRYVLQSNFEWSQLQELFFWLKMSTKNDEPLKLEKYNQIKQRLPQFLPADFISDSAGINKLPLYEQVETIIRIFGLNELNEDIIYLQAFLDEIFSYTRNEKGDLVSFMAWWNEKGARKSVQVPEGQNAIRIMTIHKSKGLEFKAVLVPFCNWLIPPDSLKNNILWADSTEMAAPFNSLSALPVRYSDKLSQTYFAPDYENELAASYLDNINLLYVAFTRAVQVLLVTAPLPKAKKDGSYPLRTVGDLLFQLCRFPNEEAEVIAGKETIFLNDAWDEESHCLELGNLVYHSEKEKEQAKKFAPYVFRSEKWRGRITIRPQSKGQLKEWLDPNFSDYWGEDRLDLQSGKLNLGVLVHDTLAKINTLADVPKVLSRIRATKSISSDEVSLLSDNLSRLFANPQVADWFSEGWLVKSEMEILQPTGEIRRPDRVLFKDNHAIVLDFKTGIRKDNHKAQVKEYCKLLMEMGSKSAEGYLVYVGEAEVKKVV